MLAFALSKGRKVAIENWPVVPGLPLGLRLTVDAAVESDGRFAALLSERITVTGSELYGEAFYIGTYRWAPSRSGRHLLG